MNDAFKPISGGTLSGSKYLLGPLSINQQSWDRNHLFRSHIPIKPTKFSPSTFTGPSTKEAVDEVDLIQVFGRLAETKLFGDASAGQCCGGGCFDCQWRDAFEILESSKPTWIPTYRYSYSCLDALYIDEFGFDSRW